MKIKSQKNNTSYHSTLSETHEIASIRTECGSFYEPISITREQDASHPDFAGKIHFRNNNSNENVYEELNFKRRTSPLSSYGKPSKNSTKRYSECSPITIDSPTPTSGFVSNGSHRKYRFNYDNCHPDASYTDKWLVRLPTAPEVLPRRPNRDYMTRLQQKTISCTQPHNVIDIDYCKDTKSLGDPFDMVSSIGDRYDSQEEESINAPSLKISEDHNMTIEKFNTSIYEEVKMRYGKRLELCGGLFTSMVMLDKNLRDHDGVKTNDRLRTSNSVEKLIDDHSFSVEINNEKTESVIKPRSTRKKLLLMRKWSSPHKKLMRRFNRTRSEK